MNVKQLSIYHLRPKQVKPKRMDVYKFTFSSEKDDSDEEYVPSSDEGNFSDLGRQESFCDENNSAEPDIQKICEEINNQTTDADEPPIEIIKTTNTARTRIYDKKQYCLFCEKPYSKITKHWLCIHAAEPEVIKISTEADRKKKLVLITNCSKK